MLFVRYIQHLFFSYILPTTSYMIEICCGYGLRLYALILNNLQTIIALMIAAIIASISLRCFSV